MTGPIVNSVSQVSLQIKGTDAEATFAAVRAEILKWLNKKAGRVLPPEAWEGKRFELFREVGYQPVAATTLDCPRLWACKLDDADKQVPQRTWTTEVGLSPGPGGTIIFGCRLLCITMGEYVPFMPTIPGFVRQIAERFEASIDGR